jgi:hypothetical protein
MEEVRTEQESRKRPSVIHAPDDTLRTYARRQGLTAALEWAQRKAAGEQNEATTAEEQEQRCVW